MSSPNGGGGPVATPEAVLKVRGRLLARIAYIVAILRIQFAPATVLFWNYITQHRLRPDVVHCNDLDTLLVGVLAKQRLGSRLVYDAHEFFPVSDVHGRWIDVAFFKLIERTLIDKADAVFTVNPMLAEAMRQTYGLRAVHSLPNAEPWNGMQPAAGEFDDEQSGGQSGEVPVSGTVLAGAWDRRIDQGMGGRRRVQIGAVPSRP